MVGSVVSSLVYASVLSKKLMLASSAQKFSETKLRYRDSLLLFKRDDISLVPLLDFSKHMLFLIESFRATFSTSWSAPINANTQPLALSSSTSALMAVPSYSDEAFS